MIRILDNHVLLTALTAWFLAQLVKLPLQFFHTRHWDWSLFFGSGGMPSSHSALMVAATYSIGLHLGFDSPMFALAFALSMVVLYDATGIRRQAGKQAEVINAMIQDLAAGHPLRQEQLREMLGHTPLEVAGGVLFGLVVAEVEWILFK